MSSHKTTPACLLDAESGIREHTLRGEMKEAATLAIAAGGPEIIGFLMAMLRNPESAGEVFSQFCEDLWTGLPRFQWQCSFRAWAYLLARNAMCRYQQDAFRRRGVPLSAHPAISQLEAEVRTRTLDYLRTDVKSRAARLRERLEPEEQMLLILRVDRGLSFSEVAEVMAEPGATPDQVRRLAVALRKRFERVKERLRALMAEEGMLEPA